MSDLSNYPSHFELNGCSIGDGFPTFVIAEVAQSHDGSLDLAHTYIDAAADAGANAIKFQAHIASEESTLDENFRVKFSSQDKTRYDYWKRMEFSFDEWKQLIAHAETRGLVFLCSPFSLAAVSMLQKLGVVGWKIGAGEVASSLLLDHLKKLNQPLLLSTGMIDWEEIDAIVSDLRLSSSPFALFQCTSKYPTPIEEVGINIISQLKSKYNCPVGLSDHSGNPFVAIAAASQGCHLLEVHVVLDRRMRVPDQESSLTFEQLSMVTNYIQTLDQLRSNPVDKDLMCKDLSATRQLFGRSLALTNTQVAGSILSADMLTYKKPGTGIPPSMLMSTIGKRLKRTVNSDRLLKWEDFE